MSLLEVLVASTVSAAIVGGGIYFYSRLSRAAENAKRANDAEARLRILQKQIKEDFERRLVPRGTGKGLAGGDENPGYENEMFVMPGDPFTTPAVIPPCVTKESEAACMGLRLRLRHVDTDKTGKSSFTIRTAEWSTECAGETNSPVTYATAPQMHPDMQCAAPTPRPRIRRAYTDGTGTAVRLVPEAGDDSVHGATLCFRAVGDCTTPAILRSIEGSLAIMYHGVDGPHVVRDSFNLAVQERNPSVEKIPP